MSQYTREIESIIFGIYSPEEILNMSVCKIDSSKKSSGVGTVYDPRMGTTDSSQKCETCKENATDCPGHFGHIELNEPIVHPLFYKRVASFLTCFCFKCNRLILQRDQIFISNLNRYKGEARFTKILDKIKKVDICCQPTNELDSDGIPLICGKDHPKIKFNTTDASFSMIYDDGKNNKISIVLSTEEIKKIFDSIIPEDIELLGFDPTITQPRNFIISVLPVLPPCDRPYVRADNKMCDDDLTIQYIEIVKANNSLIEDDSKQKKGESVRQRALASLRFRILTTFNNGKGKAKHTTNGRPIKGIKERLTGKDGQIRNNMMGKRSCTPETPILLWSGKIKTAKNIKKGDIVIGDDGFPRKVVNTLTGKSQLYKVQQFIGDDYCISCEHILTLWYKDHCDIKWNEKKSEWIMKWYNGRDITTSKVGISNTKTKKEACKILKEIRNVINQDPVIDIHVKDYLSLPDSERLLMFGIKLANPIKWKFKETTLKPRILGMRIGRGEYKHIPRDYIINSEKVRLELLSGIIDMIGKIERKSTIITCKNIYILNEIKFIVSSLGFQVTTCGSKLTIYDYSEDDIFFNTFYPIKVVDHGVGQFCGFEVDQNNRFLLGDFTITHNCDQTARTVIGPDPTLCMGELGIPEEIAKILTIPICVASFNISYLQEMINEGKIKSIWKPDNETMIDIERYRKGTRLMYGDIIHRNGKTISVVDGRELVREGDKVERSGKFLSKLKPANRKYNIDIGWTVDRPLNDGDYVLLNRQPTLHKASMMAMQVVIKPFKTLRMNLAITKSFNADFDGDEMNIHVPQSLEAQAELKYLSAAQWNMISPQSSKPNMAIVQDSLIGAYRMTQGVKKLSKGNFFNIAMKLKQAPWSKYESTDGMMSSVEILSRIQHTRRILKQKGKKIQCYNGRGIVSLFLPEDFNYEKINNKHPNEPAVKIYRGIMYEGTIDKSIIGASHNSIHQVLHKEYGVEAASYFIDCIQFSTNQYLLVDGFTVGLGDCLITQTVNKNGITKEEEIKDVVQKCYIEAEAIKQATSHPNIREIRINAALNKAKDIGLRIAKDALSEDNNFLSTVRSGSKGDFFNIAQITGLLGQQNLNGKRVPLLLNHGVRSLPHYPFSKLDPQMEYESRGFIDRGFLRGLNPRQFYFHAMSGREGICDTAMGTATSGYMQRRIIKLTEDMKIQHDGTVRDISGNLYQMSYGQFGVDPAHTIKVKGDQEMCDITRMVERLNMNYELKKK